jgi:hypothetical protein
MPRSKVLRCIRAYLEESWDGDLIDIMCGGLGSFALKYGSYLNNKSLDEYKFFKRLLPAIKSVTDVLTVKDWHGNSSE